jgi:hypothetical protein
MPAHLRIRRTACCVALAALVLAPAAASAAQVSALDSTFAGGAGGWSSTSSCAPLCSVTSAIDPGPGANEPGAASVVYTPLAGLLGGLASGTSTWTSPSFTWTDATPDSAVVSYARKAAIGGLLTVGGSASSRLQLRDVTAGTLTTLASGSISTADAAFAEQSVAINPSLLVQTHSYRLLVTTNLSAAALLSNIEVAYDDIGVTGISAPPLTSGGGDPSGGGGAGQPSGSGSGSAPGTPASVGSGGSQAAIRLVAAHVVHYLPGHAITLRVRATRAGKAVAGLKVTLHFGTSTRRLTTGREGYASLRLQRRVRAALRITFRAGNAGAITWARPR